MLPSWTVGAIVVVPGGAHPSYAHGYYARDNAFYIAWDAISRDRDERFRRWMDTSIVTAGDVPQAATMTYRASEMMTVAAARALGNDDICFVGIGLPSAACNLARLTHAPGSAGVRIRHARNQARRCCRSRSATANCARPR